MSYDGHINFGYSTVLTAPSPAASGTTLTLASGGGALMPATPFNAAVWPTGTGPLMSNAEIVRVTNVTGDDLTIVREQEGTTAKSIAVGWQFANTITVKNFTDIEDAITALPQFAIQSISAGTTVATGPQIVFSNANGVTFGVDGNTITASANAGAGGGAAISAGANSQSTGTVNFSNSNGVTFGLSNNGVMTASHNGITSQSVQTQGSVAILGSTGAISFANSNGITFGGNASTVTASHNGLTSQSGQAASAANGSFAFQTLSFSNANGISFGTSAGSALTASHNGITSQTVQTQSNVQGLSAGTQVGRTGDIAFADSNGISFGMSNSSRITASYTVPSTAGLISAINFSAGTTSNNLSALTFSNSGGVSFGLNGSVVTATVATNYQSQGAYLTTARASNDAVGLNTALTANGVSWTVNSSGISLNVPAFLTTAMQSNAATISNVKFSAGTTSNNMSALTFGDGGGVSFGLNGSVITASAPAGAPSPVNFSAGTTSGNLGSVVFSNSNQITFGLDGATITASFNPINFGLSNIGNTAGNTGTLDGAGAQLVFAGVNNITLSGSTNGQSMTITVSGGAAGGGGSIENYVPFQFDKNNTSFSSFNNNSLYMQMFVPPGNLTFNKFEIYARGTFVSSTNSQAYSQTIRYGLYSQGTGASSTLMSQIGSSSATMGVSFNSNTAGGYTFGNGVNSFTSTSGGTALFTAISGPFHFYLPFASSATANLRHGFAFAISSTTAVNTAAMRFAPLVFTAQNSLSYAKINIDSVTAPAGSNYGDWDMAMGTVSTAAMPSTIALSAMTIAVSRQKLFLQMEL